MIKLIILLLLLFTPQPDRYKAERERMVRDQIAARGITDQAVLRAMRKVQRHQFVPASQVANAYYDGPLPIGEGQTISQPYIVAYMTAILKPKKAMKVLEIGTGSGYQAAVLAEIVGKVYSIEIVPELGKSAALKLKGLGYDHVVVRVADGYKGWKEHAPFDAIMVTAAAERIPPPLIQQLKEGGRMIIPLESGPLAQQLVLVEKIGGKIKTKNVLPVRFVPFTRAR